MESSDFLCRLYEHYDHDPLKLSQESEYLSRINAVAHHKRREWFAAVLETSKRFPTIADLALSAKNLGVWAEPASQAPHTWVKTDCRMCRGSGMTAAMWEQEFSRGEDQPVTQTLRLVSLVPYQESGIPYRENPNWLRTIFRCDCMAGEARTLPKWPRWSPNQPMIRERAWQ